MFTNATKKFGVWKEERANNVISYKLISRQFLFSLGMAAFISWIFFIIAIKIREEFFLFESASKTFIKFNDIKNSNNGFFIKERKAAISIYLSMDKSNNIRIIFENGKSYLLPSQASNFLEYFEEKRKNIMLTALIMRVDDPSISRVKIWTDKSLSFKNIKYIIKIFSQFGYDDFDIAVER
jgi:hypothetical protein